MTSVIICDPRLTIQHSLSQMLHPLRPLAGIICVPDGFALVDAYSAQAADIVLIGIDRSSNSGAEAMGLQLAMHPHSVIITVGAVTDADLLVAATLTGARGLLGLGSRSTTPRRPATRWAAPLVTHVNVRTFFSRLNRGFRRRR